MTKYSVIIDLEAESNLQDILRYIKEDLENPHGAERIVVQITKKCFSLELFPKRSSSRIINGRKVYTIHCRRYSIIYSINEQKKQVRVWSIIYSPHLNP